MKDTSARIELIHRKLLMSRDGCERLRMGCDMFDTAREIALAGLRLSAGKDVRVALFLRFYGDDFDARTRERILVRIRSLDTGMPTRERSVFAQPDFSP